MAGTCYIVGAGAFNESAFRPGAGDYVIAADGGHAHAPNADLILGDFDSLGYVPEGGNVVRFRAEKDDTDMALAAREGVARGYRRLVLLGGMGGRLDHTLANIQLLSRLAAEGARAYLVGADCACACVMDGSMRFDPSHAGYLSVFALGDEARGVDETGLQYALRDATLSGDRALGVSNAFTGSEAVVRARSGRLLALWYAPLFPLPEIEGAGYGA